MRKNNENRGISEEDLWFKNMSDSMTLYPNVLSIKLSNN